ncbi:uncharacterized protein LOC133758704 [Lepus europaeus]|uniref:uncharacterized protein LOC133758704 n=1 Tax=Lepus europaeus TaxID=9983 RepID=UPI002B45FE2D|nr:uncharacterized protein LOC133758704 [Lepus europaeus]
MSTLIWAPWRKKGAPGGLAEARPSGREGTGEPRHRFPPGARDFRPFGKRQGVVRQPTPNSTRGGRGERLETHQRTAPGLGNCRPCNPGTAPDRLPRDPAGREPSPPTRVTSLPPPARLPTCLPRPAPRARDEPLARQEPLHRPAPVTRAPLPAGSPPDPRPRSAIPARTPSPPPHPRPHPAVPAPHLRPADSDQQARVLGDAQRPTKVLSGSQRWPRPPGARTQSHSSRPGLRLSGWALRPPFANGQAQPRLQSGRFRRPRGRGRPLPARRTHSHPPAPRVLLNFGSRFPN